METSVGYITPSLHRIAISSDQIISLTPYPLLRMLRARSHTKPGTLLKHQIPIRAFAEWDEQQPGFVEMDLVAHNGGLASGTTAKHLI
jgi:hypothetical protein